MEGVSINIRVKRNGEWEHVEIDKLTAEELTTAIKHSPAAQLAALRAALSAPAPE